jgi:hypothetical protein
VIAAPSATARGGSPEVDDYSERALSQERRSPARRRKEEALNGDESSNVTDVAVQLRDDDRMRVVKLSGEAA